MTVSSSPTPDQNNSSTRNGSTLRSESPTITNGGISAEGIHQRNINAKKLNDPFQNSGTRSPSPVTDGEDQKLLKEGPKDRAPSKRTPFTVADLRRAIPAHCFERSYLTSFAYLCVDLCAIFTLFYLSSYIDQISSNFFVRHILWTVYWCLQGSIMTGLWVIGHECGHGGFSPSETVNDFVGIIVHSLLLVPYYAWKISHRRHHSNTGNIDRDEVHVPGFLPRNLWERRAKRFLARKALEKAVTVEDKTTVFVDDDDDKAPVQWFLAAVYRFIDIVKMLVFGWPAYLMFNVSAHRNYPKDQLVNHFIPSSPIFTDNERWSIVVSDIVLFLVLSLFTYVSTIISFTSFVYYYGIPYLIVNAFLVLITFLQHTDESLPHYDENEWDWLRGALTTVDRSFGILNILHHHIADTHVCHHLFSFLPHYHAEEATVAIKKVLGEYYREDLTPIPTALWRQFGNCKGLVPDAENKGVYWF